MKEILITIIMATGKGLNVMNMETVLSILTGSVFYITLVELFWLLNFRLNAGWLLAIVIYGDFLALLLGREFIGCNFLIIILLFPIGFLIMKLLNSPRYLNVLFNEQIFIFIVFIAYTSLSLLWSDNKAYGIHKLSFLLLHGLVPAMYILIGFSINKRFSWNQSLNLGLLTCVTLIFFSKTAAIHPGRNIFLAQDYIWAPRASLLTAILTLWLPIPVIIKIPAIITCLSAALIMQSYEAVVSFLCSLVIVWLITSFPEKFKPHKLLNVIPISLTIFILVFLSIYRIDALNSSTELLNVSLGGLYYPERIISFANFSGRISDYIQAFNIFKEHSLMGVGIGGYSNEFKDFGYVPAPCNILLEVLSELGLIGFSLWSVFVMMTLKKLSKSPIPLSIFLFSLFYSLFSGDLGSNYEYVLIGLAAPILTDKPDLSDNPHLWRRLIRILRDCLFIHRHKLQWWRVCEKN